MPLLQTLSTRRVARGLRSARRSDEHGLHRGARAVASQPEVAGEAAKVADVTVEGRST
jgi:hypothetical protein